MLLSAYFGVFVGKIIEVRTRQRERTLGSISLKSLKIGRYIISILAIALYNALSQLYPKNGIIKWISDYYSKFDSEVLFQIILMLILNFLIDVVDVFNSRKGRALSPDNLSKEIVAFTTQAREKSVLTIVAGDMDFFGNVAGGDSETDLMANNSEYKQIFDLSKEVSGLKILILCSHGLDSEPELLNSILNKTISPRILYSRYSNRGKLKDPTFQQLLRIGKLQTELKNVEIRFYPSESDDKHLRARFIDDSVIVYRNENAPSRVRWKRTNRFPFIKKVESYETMKIYTVHKLDEEEVKYYKDLVSLKWEAFEEFQKSEGDIILSFCQSLYRYVNNSGPRFHMALVYANSYEIARKGEKRKEFPPFGVMYLAACVRENPDWDVKLIAVDKNTSNENLDWRDYDVIGFSIISSYSYDILKRCFTASKRRRNATIIAGGYQAEKFFSNVFQDFDADIIFKGEGENSIRTFCQHYEELNFAEIPGIIYKNYANSTQATEGRGCVDIDKIPFPARDLLSTEDIVMTDRLAGTDRKMIHMLFSRGCSYNCLYCAATQDQKVNHIRYRDKLKIVEELSLLIDTYSIQGFSIIDDCFLTEAEKAIEICRYIAEQNFKLKWSLAARVDQINDDILDALASSGCIEIKFGIETGSDELLEKMKKGITVTMAEEAIRQTKSYGIGVKLFIITGLPHESDETHNKTKDFLTRMHQEKLVDRVSLLRYTPLAGSYIYDNPENFGIKKNALNANNFSKTHLYRDSYDWWSDPERFSKCEGWYADMKSFIEHRWGDA